MGLLRLAVLGTPEVFHDDQHLAFSLRKAQALLLYLAVEGGMHPRSKLAAFLWPNSDPPDARKVLRNVITLLRRLLDDPGSSASQHTHLLSQGDLFGLDPHTPLELDLDVVQHAYQQAQGLSTVLSEPQRATLVANFQQALSLVRGPFLDGFWLREEAPFDEWIEQQQQQWQVRLQLLCDRLSSWQEAAGEQEQAIVTLTRWLALDPLQEEAYRRLMRVHLALGDAAASLQVYGTCRARLAEELQVEPSADIVALAEHIRATTTGRRGSPPARPTTATATRVPTSELVAPLVGRAGAFSQLVTHYQQARQGQPQAVFVMGEAGIGKTRLAGEFVAWARAQGADVSSGQVFEMGGRLPYQPLVEAIRPRLEEENAPEDLLDDPWLAELSRILPELRVRYPDLPAPTEDELAAKLQLFEAVARLLDALAQRAPLVLLLDDLHWVDGASLDLVRYLARYWKSHGTRVLLLGTMRREGLEPKSQLAAQLSDLGRDLPLTQVTLQALSQEETLQLLEAIAGEGDHSTALPSTAGTVPSQASATPLVALGDFLFAHTGGQPLYLLETLKLLREREWLVPRLGADGTWKLEPTGDMAAAIAQERSWRELLPPSVRMMIQARLAKLSQPARQLVMAGAVLGTQASAKLLWQVADVGVQAGVEALEEAISSGMLSEGEAGGGRPGSYRFAHELVRDVVYTELGEARRQVLHQRALTLLQTEGVRASELAYHALLAGHVEAASRYSAQAGDEAVAVFAVEDAIGHYEQARSLLQEHLLQSVLATSEVEHLYAYLGRAYSFQNAWQKAQKAYEELLAYARQQRLLRLVSMTLNRLAILAVQQSHGKPQVYALLKEAWQIAETSHDQQALAETEWNFAQVTAFVWGDSPKSALAHGQHALELARGIYDTELEARSLSSLGFIHLLGGDFEEAIHCEEASLVLYAALGNEQSASRELSVAHFMSGVPPTQPLTNRASEAMCWELLALAQVHTGQVHNSMRSGRIALSLASESKNVWTHVNSTHSLAYGLLEAGAYEEALVLTQQAVTLARTFPLKLLLLLILVALGSIYQALQQWEEAQAALEETLAVAETIGFRSARALALSRLCMNCALTGEWERAYRYALERITLRKQRMNAALAPLDFYRHYETEALLRAGDESQAKAEVRQLEEGLGPYQRFRIPYLWSLAVLATREEHTEQAINHLREAARLAADIGLPGERWQIQAMLGRLYEAVGEPVQAHTAFAEAARIIQGLAESIGDETLRSRFLAAPQIQQVLQHAQRLANQVPQDHA